MKSKTMNRNKYTEYCFLIKTSHQNELHHCVNHSGLVDLIKRGRENRGMCTREPLTQEKGKLGVPELKTG